MKQILFSFLTIFILSSCATPSKILEEKVKIGDELEASKYSNLYFSAQPTMKDFENLKKQGFVAVINLREKTEYNEGEEKSKLKELDLVYENIPFSKKSKLTEDYINSVTQAVVKNRTQGKVLVHCSSGNRVGIWLGGHFYKDHNYTEEAAKAVATKLGLKSEDAKEVLNNYFKK